MRVLIISSSKGGLITPFVEEQVSSLEKTKNIRFDYALIKGKGLFGYLIGYVLYLKKIMSSKYDLVHAHYGLSGLIACLQFFKPVIVTFHGCDVNDPKTRWISKIAFKLCKYAVFVESEMPGKLNATNKFSIIPCGINTGLFKPMDKSEARKQLRISYNDKIALFASAFDVPIKNYPLAKLSCDKIPGLNLIELKNYSREKVNLLLNACDLLLLTSIREGSPQVIKEAMACNCPIVSTNVGDVKERLMNTDQTYVNEPDEKVIAESINFILHSNKRSNGREKLIKDQLDLNAIAQKIFNIYKKALN